MYVPLTWLSEYVTVDRPLRDLVSLLAMSGIEVESVERETPFTDHFVVARVLKIGRHPQAERLSFVDVDDGQGGRQVVCGAQNFQVGDRVVLALPGAILPDGREITEGVIRGVTSSGMLCSAEELDLFADHSGLFLVPEDVAPGTPLAAAHPGVGPTLELSLTPNRADCLSIRGMAREIGALTGAPVQGRTPIVHEDQEGADAATLASVKVIATERCPRYVGRVLEGVQVGPSPLWLVERLAACGIRTINNVVDATNYVMLELGQPLHAFDLDTLDGSGVEVRLAAEGETLLCLDGIERKLRSEDLVICDARGPVALAGVMGGAPTGVKVATTRLLLESARFDPLSTRKSARFHGLHTDSSHRFERGVDPTAQGEAADRLAELIVELAGGRVARGQLAVGEGKPAPVVIPLEPDWVRSYTGVSLSDADISTHLTWLGFAVDQQNNLCWQVIAPTWRMDMAQPADLAEEVVRRWGYQNLPTTTPTAPITSPGRPPLWSVGRKVRELLTGAGCHETVTYAMTPAAWLDQIQLTAGDPRRLVARLKNPLSEEMAVLRPLLLPSLLTVASFNQNRQNRDLALFEIGPVFRCHTSGTRPVELPTLAITLMGRRHPRTWDSPSDREVDIFDLRGLLEHLVAGLKVLPLEFRPNGSERFLTSSRAWSIQRGGEELGWAGELSPRVGRAFGLEAPVMVAELRLDQLVAERVVRDRPRGLPAYPRSSRDMAVTVPGDTAAGEVLMAIRDLAEPLVEDITLFDIYEGEQVGSGKKSLGFSISYRATDHTLTDKEVSEVHQRIISLMGERFSGALRT